jgi:hypothetical protein
VPDDNNLVFRGIDREFHLDIDAAGGGRRLLDVERIALPGGAGIRLTWDSRPGRIYTIDSSLDLQNWDFEVADQLPAAGGVTMFEEVLANLPLSGLQVYFRVREFVPPPVFADDFESGSGGWTSGSDGAGGTRWELGTPSNVGPVAARSGLNCWGTNIADNYGFDAEVWLRSPAIDLTAAPAAVLRYYQQIDTDFDADFGTVNILDAADNSLLAELATNISGLPADWEPVTHSLPAEALGKNVMIEFRFTSNAVENWSGWYLEDVEVTIP